MVIFVNGSFGVGKTTVARLLVRQLPESTLFDPEPIGLALMHSARLFGARVDDFQDLRPWRKLSTFMIGLLRRAHRNIVVPMAFSNPVYLNEFLSHASRFDDTYHFCLTAPFDTVLHRLNARERRGPNAWVKRRAAECCLAHRLPEFREQIETERQSPEEIVLTIRERLRRQNRYHLL